MDSQNMNGAQMQTQGKGTGTAATVFGIFALLMVCLGPVGLILSIVAIVLGRSAKKQSGNTYGSAGFVIGIIGLVLSLIITVATVAIYAGVLVPQAMKYEEKADTAADTQVCDMVRTSIAISVADATYTGDEESAQFLAIYGGGYYYSVAEIYASDCQFSESVQDCLGVYSYDELMDMIDSKDAEDIMFSIDGDDIAVKIAGTDIVVD